MHECIGLLVYEIHAYTYVYYIKEALSINVSFPSWDVYVFPQLVEFISKDNMRDQV